MLLKTKAGGGRGLQPPPQAFVLCGIIMAARVGTVAGQKINYLLSFCQLNSSCIR